MIYGFIAVIVISFAFVVWLVSIDVQQDSRYDEYGD